MKLPAVKYASFATAGSPGRTVVIGFLCLIFLGTVANPLRAQQWAPTVGQPAASSLLALPCADCDDSLPASPPPTYSANRRSLPPLPSLEAYVTPHNRQVNYQTQAYPSQQQILGYPSQDPLPDGYQMQPYLESMDDQGYALESASTQGYPSQNDAAGQIFPNRPYIVPRVVDRLQQRPWFPNRPMLRGAWSGGPALDQPRSFWLNPFSLQQGIGNFLFRGNQPADTGSLGFPFSMVPSHVVDRVPRPYLGHGQNYIQARHIDRGQPLMGTSWTNRPYYVNLFSGAFLANSLNSNTDQTSGTISGVRLGWDYDHYWGTEFRLGLGNTKVAGRSDQVDIRLADISVAYYPWGDSRWRPYTSVGLGVGNFSFLDQTFQSIDDYSIQIPISIGVKYAFKPWWGLRLDATNYLSMPSNDLEFMNNVSLTGAVEVRFGGRRRSYFPYSPSIQLK